MHLLDLVVIGHANLIIFEYFLELYLFQVHRPH